MSGRKKSYNTPCKEDPTGLGCMVYTRVSSEERLNREFTSLDNQLAKCLDYIKLRSEDNWVFQREYRDAGFTGGNLDRPALQELIKDIVAEKVDVVLVHKLDRLTRRLLHFHQLYPLMEKHNVSLVSVTQSLDTSTAVGRLVINILMSFAEFELDQTSERQHDKAYSMRQRGMRTGGRPILGFDVDPRTKQYIVNEEEAALVNEIFDRFIADPRTAALAKVLNAEGKPRKTWVKRDGTDFKPGPWSSTNLPRLLSNKEYIGITVYMPNSDVPEEYPAQHPAIVDVDKFNKAQALLNQSPYVKHSRERSEIQALLKHIVFCKTCGQPMRPRWTKGKNKRHMYYVCRNAQQNGYDSCPNPSLPAKAIEGAVIEELRRVFVSDEVYSAALRNLAKLYEERRKELEREVKQLKADLVELGGSESGSQGNAELIKAARLRDVEEELHFIQLKLINDAEVGEQLSVLDRIWEYLFLPEQARIVQLVVRQVEVEPNGIVIDFREEGFASLVQELRQECEVVEE